MIWSVPELVSRISHLIRFYPGDLIFTGTPAGVGPVAVGDTLVASIGGLEPQLEVQITG
jgi:fumarylpyruvate hydrolase